MKIKAVSFDIGDTLVKYNNPLNWKSLYEPALKQVSKQCGFPFSNEMTQAAIAVLMKYNTRENPREYEVTSKVIFTEILDAINLPHDVLDIAKNAFYGFFQADAVCYDDVVDTLNYLKSTKLQIGASTDVAYGMDNCFVLKDIATIHNYFDLVLTSVDVGYRKPNSAGFLMLLKAFDISPPEMIYVGNEQKDIDGSNALGIVSVLIDRKGASPDWGQKYTIQSLLDIRKLF